MCGGDFVGGGWFACYGGGCECDMLTMPNIVVVVVMMVVVGRV